MKRGRAAPSLIVAAGCLLGLLTLHVACGSTETSLPGSVYAKVVPVYPGSKYVELEGIDRILVEGRAEDDPWPGRR